MLEAVDKALVGIVSVVFVQALVALTAEVIEVVLVIRNRVMRKPADAELELNVAAHGDVVGILERLWVF